MRKGRLDWLGRFDPYHVSWELVGIWMASEWSPMFEKEVLGGAQANCSRHSMRRVRLDALVLRSSSARLFHTMARDKHTGRFYAIKTIRKKGVMISGAQYRL